MTPAQKPLISGTNDIAAVGPGGMTRLDVEAGEDSGKRGPHCLRIVGVGHATADPLDEKVDGLVGSLHHGECTNRTGRLPETPRPTKRPALLLALPGTIGYSIGTMPVVAINMDVPLYTAVEEALINGNYADLQQFLVVAVRNQLALEASTGVRSGAGVVAPPVVAPDLAALPERLATTSPVAPDDLEGVRAMLGALPATTVALPDPARMNGDAVLWGQINRVLPIAVGLRVLGHLSVEHPEGVSVEMWHDAATSAAVGLRSRLRQLDQEAGRRHGSLWATAFPDDTPASAHRYTNQFLGFPNGDGGAVFLGFVAFERDDAVATLTSAGAQWASLSNPLFDGVEPPTRTFSVEETRFFIDHLTAYRPAELNLLKRIAALVDAGHSRTELDETLAAEYPRWAKYIETMRAGALGRLSDLGLLERTRRGLTVDYALTPLASEVGLLPDARSAA